MLKLCIAILAILPLCSELNASDVVAHGTGFAVGKDGYVMTNAHVVSECADITIRIGGVEEPTKLLSLDVQNDLALLKIPHTFDIVLPLRESSGSRIRLGEAVAAFGYPLQGIISTSLNMTTGIISSLAGLGDDARALQFTAPIQPGNSGGPLIDASGNVVGIVTSKLSPLWAARHTGDLPQNVNFAIKASAIREFLESRSVEFDSGRLGTSIPTADLPSKVGPAVFPIQCVVRSGMNAKQGNHDEQAATDRRPGVVIGGYGPTQWFQTIFLDAENALSSYGVLIANRPSVMQRVDGDAFSIATLLSAVQRQGSDYLLYLTVEATAAKLHARAQCFDASGTLLWEERITNSFALTWEGGARNVSKQLIQRLKTRVGKAGLPLRGSKSSVRLSDR